MKAIFLALMTSLAYGISAPIAKVGFKKGMSPDGMVFTFCLSLIVFLVPSLMNKGVGSMFPNNNALVWGLFAGLSSAIGFRLASEALSVPTALVSIVVVLIALHPTVASTVSLVAFREFESLCIWKFTAGIFMVLGGGYIVITSIK